MTFTVRHGQAMALIEIDGLPNLKKWVDLSTAMLVITRGLGKHLFAFLPFLFKYLNSTVC